MTTLIEQIEEMRLRMNQLATEEHGLVTSLGDVLASADQRLLEEVRDVAAAHEARRGEILRELQALAGRMCALHKPDDDVSGGADRFSRDDDRRRTEATLEDQIASQLRIGRRHRA